MRIESPKVTANKSEQEMFEFLINPKNYEQLMPENKEVFEVRDEKTFVFGLKGMPVIKLEIQETRKPELVVLGSTSDKFDFKLKAHISTLNENQSEVQMEFGGEFNAMMAMMVKKPLTKFINTLAENIGKL
ncbi:SRPBCC domain-containing protein [Salegentibacter maritimus]|uniref:SRPBCC domain-containing protein n=1 Tax=Salegentibacter maritimus TaxID=2794347 RepID=UPI0018E4D390|nr:SRPBCC domain-containing protein [Salegentibacter maritimus]MBI6117794.1 SRPBCC family protein [Salegentibacter maritimus]